MANDRLTRQTPGGVIHTSFHLSCPHLVPSLIPPPLVPSLIPPPHTIYLAPPPSQKCTDVPPELFNSANDILTPSASSSAQSSSASAQPDWSARRSTSGSGSQVRGWAFPHERRHRRISMPFHDVRMIFYAEPSGCPLGVPLHHGGLLHSLPCRLMMSALSFHPISSHSVHVLISAAGSSGRAA